MALLPVARRTASGYRQYEQNDVHTLHFVRHSRDLGFSLTEIAGLLSLWQNRRRPSRQVKALAEAHIPLRTGRVVVRHRTDSSMAQVEYLAAAAPLGRCSQPGHRMQHPFRTVRGLLITAPTGPRARLTPVRRQFRDRQRVRP